MGGKLERRQLLAFKSTLRNEVDLNQLCEQFLAVVQETMQPASISIWLRPSAHERVSWSVIPSIERSSSLVTVK